MAFGDDFVVFSVFALPAPQDPRFWKGLPPPDTPQKSTLKSPRASYTYKIEAPFTQNPHFKNPRKGDRLLVIVGEEVATTQA